MPLNPRSRLGPYEIVGPLGAGGMGEVYRARDTRLGREVALKVLPAEWTGDPVRTQRLDQEARAIAALNHPNIVAVYDVGIQAGVSYMVTELVDGEPLRGPKFGLRKTMELAAQIAGGLAAAHEAGVVHRDLKPDNILLARDGRVKILDFGLAKVGVRKPGSSGYDDETQIVDVVRTAPGVILGTIDYMSPEQVRGLDADPRSDIFSFGLVLFELLTGARAFQGETAVDTMRAILRQDAPELPETVPAVVRQIVSHCLEKEPRNRFQSARDLSFALTSLALSGSQSIDAPSSKVGSRRRAPLMLIWLSVAALAIVAAAAAILFWRSGAQPVWSGVMLGGPEIAIGPRVAPDGRLVAFQAMVHGLTQVAVMSPESGNWSVLTRRRDIGQVMQVSWSPDGSLLYYDRVTDVPQGIFSVPVLGGEEHLVLENASWPEVLADGSLLIFRLNAQRHPQLFRFWPESGRLMPLPLEPGDMYHATVLAFPDARAAVVLGKSASSQPDSAQHLFEVDLTSGRARRWQSGLDESKVETGCITRDGKLVLLSVAARNTRRIVGLPRAGGLGGRTLAAVTSRPWALSAGPDGDVYMDLWERSAEVVRFPVDGGHAEKLATFPFVPALHSIAVLPDGRMVVPVTVGGHDRLMAVEAAKDSVPLLTTTEETSAPAAALGRDEIAFTIGQEPRQTIGVAALATGRVVRRISLEKGRITSLAAAPDGKMLYAAAGGMVWAIPAQGGTARAIRPGEAVAVGPAGRVLTILTNESARVRLFRVPVDGTREQEIVPGAGDRIAYSYSSSPNSVASDGRMAVTLAPPDSWFWPPGLIDPLGRVTRIQLDYTSDFHSVAWMPDGRLVALALDVRSRIWRFHPEGR